MNFLRKIRQRLLTENRVSQYLLYAVGEILLVVVGILIALQIDTWNNLRKEEQQALVYLENLRADFENHKKVITATYNELEKTKKCARYIDDYITGKVIILDTFELISSLNRAAFIINLKLQNSTWGEIISAGDLNLITNQLLKARVSHFLNDYQIMADLDERKYNPVSLEYLKYSSKFFDVSNGYMPTSVNSNFSRAGIWVDLNGIRQNAEMSSLLRRVFRSANEQQDFIMTILMVRCNEIIEMIANEVD